MTSCRCCAVTSGSSPRPSTAGPWADDARLGGGARACLAGQRARAPQPGGARGGARGSAAGSGPADLFPDCVARRRCRRGPFSTLAEARDAAERRQIERALEQTGRPGREGGEAARRFPHDALGEDAAHRHDAGRRDLTPFGILNVGSAACSEIRTSPRAISSAPQCRSCLRSAFANPPWHAAWHAARQRSFELLKFQAKEDRHDRMPQAG